MQKHDTFQAKQNAFVHVVDLNVAASAALDVAFDVEHFALLLDHGLRIAFMALHRLLHAKAKHGVDDI
jgi:hypothetical protein